MRIFSLCAIAFSAAWTLPAFAGFKCVDEKGRTHIGETLPEACANVISYEIGRTGSVIRKIDPAAAADERAAKEKAAEEKKASAERKRRDSAILDQYSSAQEIDTVRDRNVELINNRLATSRANLQKAKAREQEAQRAADARGKAVSPQLTAELERAKAEHAAAATSVARLERDLEATQARFAADKKRWLELRGSK